MALTDIDKNLVIAALESALAYGRANAGVTSYATIERLVRQLRTQYRADPDAVSERLVKRAWEMLYNATPPAAGNLGRISRYLRDNTFPPGTADDDATAGTGVFDGSTTFDGSTRFDGGGQGGTFDGSATFDGSTNFDGGATDDVSRFDGSQTFDGSTTFSGSRPQRPRFDGTETFDGSKTFDGS